MAHSQQESCAVVGFLRGIKCCHVPSTTITREGLYQVTIPPNISKVVYSVLRSIYSMVLLLYSNRRNYIQVNLVSAATDTHAPNYTRILLVGTWRINSWHDLFFMSSVYLSYRKVICHADTEFQSRHGILRSFRTIVDPCTKLHIKVSIRRQTALTAPLATT